MAVSIMLDAGHGGYAGRKKVLSQSGMCVMIYE